MRMMVFRTSPVLGLILLGWCGTLLSAFIGSSPEPRRLVTRHAEEASYELWADFREKRLAKPLKSWAVKRESESGQVTVHPSTGPGPMVSAQVKTRLLNLARTLREKFQKIGVELPKGKLVSGIVVDKQWAEEVLEEVEDLQIPVYTARKEVEGEKMGANSFFVCKATDGTPVACLQATEVRLSSTQPHAAHDVFGLEDEQARAERLKKEAEEMKRYREGLDDPEKYVPPPPHRMRELFGLPPEPRKLDRSRLVAKTLPPDALLWGRALMERRKGHNAAVTNEVTNEARRLR